MLPLPWVLQFKLPIVQRLIGEVSGAVHLHKKCLFLTPLGSSLMQVGGWECERSTGQLEVKTTTKPPPHPPEGPLGLWFRRVTTKDASDQGRHREWERPKGRKKNQNPCRSQGRLELPPQHHPPPPQHCQHWLAPGSGGTTDNSEGDTLKHRAQEV